MRLPASTRRSEIRPAIGARTSVHSRLSSACLSAASSEPTAPAASRCVDLRVSNSRSVTVWLCDQRRRALDVEGRDLELGARALEVGLGLLDRELVGTRIDHEQQVALLDDLAVLEMDGIDEAGNARAHFDRRHRREAAGVFVPFGDRLLKRPRDGHGRRRRSRGLRRLAVASGQDEGGDQQGAKHDHAHHRSILRYESDHDASTGIQPPKAACIAGFACGSGSQ